MPHWAPMQPPLMRMAPAPLKEEAKDGDSEGVTVDDYSGKAKLQAAKSAKVDLDVEARLNGFQWAGVHTTAKVEHLCPQGKGPDKEGYSLVLFNCFSGKKFDALRSDLNKHSYDRVSGLLYYLVGLTAPEGGLKQFEVVPEPRLMGTSADDVRKHKSDLEKYLEYLTLLNPVRQGADKMLSHHEAVLRQCTNPSMTSGPASSLGCVGMCTEQCAVVDVHSKCWRNMLLLDMCLHTRQMRQTRRGLEPEARRRRVGGASEARRRASEGAGERWRMSVRGDVAGHRP